MEKTKIVSVVFLLISIGLAIYLGNSISFSINESEKVEMEEQKVIEKLMMIREAEIAYQAVNGDYTSDWGKLKNFVDSGQFYIVDKIEHIITLAYGADSVYVEIDTLGTVFVKDSLFTTDKYPGFDLSTLSNVPHDPKAEFGLWADEIDKSGVKIDVVEVWNTSPVKNSGRKEDNDARTRKPLRFGSRTNITTAGNWE